MTYDKRVARARTLTAADWIDAACRAIAAAGIGAVAVEPLAQRLGVTKGSFYWHFPNREALLRAALARWEEEATEGVIRALAELADPRDRLVRLFGEAFTGDDDDPAYRPAEPIHTVAFALAVADATGDPVVGPVLRRVSERRIAYLEGCFGALGFGPEEARQRALLSYSAYVGTLRLAREAPGRMPSGEEGRAYRRHLVATLLPHQDAGDPRSS